MRVPSISIIIFLDPLGLGISVSILFFPEIQTDLEVPVEPNLKLTAPNISINNL